MADYGSQPKICHINTVPQPMAETLCDLIGAAAYGWWHKVCQATTPRMKFDDTAAEGLNIFYTVICLSTRGYNILSYNFFILEKH